MAEPTQTPNQPSPPVFEEPSHKSPVQQDAKERFKLSKREIVFIIIIVLLLAGVGAYAFSLTRSKSTQDINSFDECVAAGNPVMESYPEQCAANGKTFTNPNQEPVTPPANDTSETQSWTSYTSTRQTYTVRIPDGWELLNITDTENLYGGKLADLSYVPGVRGSVETNDGGWDGASPFALYVPQAGSEGEITKEGDKTGEFTTDQGLTAEKYFYEQTVDPDGIGFQKGDKVVSYYFGENGKHIHVQHVYGNGELDQTGIVENMLKTLVIN